MDILSEDLAKHISIVLVTFLQILQDFLCNYVIWKKWYSHVFVLASNTYFPPSPSITLALNKCWTKSSQSPLYRWRENWRLRLCSCCLYLHSRVGPWCKWVIPSKGLCGKDKVLWEQAQQSRSQSSCPSWEESGLPDTLSVLLCWEVTNGWCRLASLTISQMGHPVYFGHFYRAQTELQGSTGRFLKSGTTNSNDTACESSKFDSHK